MLVLWVLALLTVMAGSVVMTGRTEAHLANNRVAEAELRALGDAAVAMVALRLRSTDEQDRWYPDGTPHILEFAGRAVEVAVYNETSRIDLNTANETTLQGLLQAVGVPGPNATRLALAVVGWREAGDNMRFGGVTSADYRGAGLPYGPKRGPFATVEELSMVFGFDQHLLATLLPHLTVDTRGTALVEEYADPVVLSALGKTDDLHGPEVGVDGTRGLGGPQYRIRVRLTQGGPALDVLIFFRGIEVSTLWRRISWNRVVSAQ